MYEKLAEFYDTFMNDVPYEQWINYTARILGARKRGVDAGCGTGRFTIGLKRLGYELIGTDLSPEMLALANKNAKKAGENIVFVLQSACELRTATPVDFVVACCDVVNYIKNPIKFFERVYSSLTDGGVLVFDISTEYKLKNVIGNNVFSESTEEVTYIWENFPSAKRVDMALTFFEKQPNGLYEKTVDEQTQYVHRQEDICAALKAAGFVGVNTFDFLSDEQPTRYSDRIHFVAYKGTEVWAK